MGLDPAYFRSNEYHDPVGHFVEIATNTPGFTVEKSKIELDRTLKIPHRLQLRRSEIERRLTPIPERGQTGR